MKQQAWKSNRTVGPGARGSLPGLRKWLELNADCWFHGQTILIGAPGMERLTARNCILIHLRVAGGFRFRVVRNEREPLW